MKILVVLTLLYLTCLSSASPLKALNGPFVDIPEIVSLDDSNHRWSYVPDGEGRAHLVDLNPYDTPVEPLYVPDNDVVFLLYTRSNPTTPQILTHNNLASMINSNFNPSHPTRFTVHGWNGDRTDPVNSVVTPEYLRHGDYNMITVDWSVGAITINYIAARNRVGDTGRFVANFVDFLHLNNFVNFETLHVIGHSLGGHIAGFVGKHVSRGQIQVIYALDPAGPLFSLDNPAGRVAPTDGVYVEIMHTNGGLLGFRQPIGQASFFPNFGRSQPGCGADVGGSCAHQRTAFFYAESINTAFPSVECASFEEIDNNQCTPTGRTANMGGPVGNIGLTGNYFLTTNEESPFSQG